MKNDVDTVLRHFGVDHPDDMTVDHHEQLSRWGEQYMREVRLRARSWPAHSPSSRSGSLKSIRTLPASTEISPEMRGIFDRAPATPRRSPGGPAWK